MHLVQRHHQPAAEEPVPDAIDDRPGEEVAVAGRQRHLDELRPALNRGEGGAPSSFLAFWSRSFSVFFSSAVASRPASGSAAFRPVRNIIRACRSDALGRLEP